LVGADLKQDVDVLMVFEDVFEFDDVVMAEGLVNFYLRYQLNKVMSTFCLARERLSVLLAMILAADIFLVYRLVTS
jgi:glutamate synthase domain-containing protein 1